MRILIAGFFIVGVLVAAGSFGLFGCVCPPDQYQREPPSNKPLTEPIFSTSQGNKQ